MNYLDSSIEFTHALELMHNSTDSLFITGRAGTGKSTLLTAFIKSSPKNNVVLAPTAVAALNVRGTTIHSFFGFKPDITIEKAWKLATKTKKPDLYKNLDNIIIDEISMVRADLLDCIDAFMRRVCTTFQPFGGKRVIFIGDLYQLPPVVTQNEKSIYSTRYGSPFFFAADVIARLSLIFIELKHIYRQSDQDFINALNAIREGSVTSSQLALLNTRYSPDYAPPPEELIVNITGTNKNADKYNQYQLATLTSEPFSYQATSTGQFDSHTEPSPKVLSLKVGAQVMVTYNDPAKRYYNGSIGRVEDISFADQTPVISIRLSNHKLVDISPVTWEIFEFEYNNHTGRITSKVTGTYTQLPLTLSWAVTIHKAQGKTFERVIIDLPYSFAHGQTYVALSRATTLDGIYLRHLLSSRHVILDNTVSTWITYMRSSNTIT